MTPARLSGVLLGCLVVVYSAECQAEVKEAFGCHGNCTVVSLECPEGGHIALVKAWTRHKALNHSDSCPALACQPSCCLPAISDCVTEMTSELFRRYFDGCWGNSSCHMPAFFESQFCSPQFQEGTSLVQLHYACVTESQGISFNDSKSVAGATVVAFFNSQDHVIEKTCDRNWTCHVTSPAGNPVVSDVLLVNPNADESERKCVTLAVAKATQLQCGSVFTSGHVTTPYDVTVYPCDVRGNQTLWAVMHGRNGTLNITCNVNAHSVRSFPTTKDTASSGGLSAGAIAMIVVGVLVIVLVGLSVLVNLFGERSPDKVGHWWKDLPPRLPWTQKDDAKPIMKDQDVPANGDQSSQDGKNQYGSFTTGSSK